MWTGNAGKGLSRAGGGGGGSDEVEGMGMMDSAEEGSLRSRRGAIAGGGPLEGKTRGESVGGLLESIADGLSVGRPMRSGRMEAEEVASAEGDLRMTRGEDGDAK